MNIFVINLSSAIERRNFQDNQLTNLGLKYEILDAISIDNISKETYNQHKSDWQRPLKKTEVACYYSHRSAWNKIINANEPALILEDDALLSKSVPEIVNFFNKKDGVDLINLEAAGRKKFVSKTGEPIPCDSTLLKLYQDRNGAAGYILWPSGAKKLLQHENKNGIALADASIATCYTLSAYQIEPAAIIQLDKCDYYGIQNNYPENAQISIIGKNYHKGSAIFYVKRIVAQIKLGLHQLRIIQKSKRRYIRIIKEDFL